MAEKKQFNTVLEAVEWAEKNLDKWDTGGFKVNVLPDGKVEMILNPEEAEEKA